MEPIAWQENAMRRSSGIAPECADYGTAAARRALAFHAGFPSYAPTLLTPLSGLAAEPGLGARSRVLLICTEGDAAPVLYRQIVRYGRYACKD